MSESGAPVTLAEPNDAEERIVGHSPRGQAGSRLLVSLSRAARSFLLYEPTNEAIRHFLEALRDAADAYFNVYGNLSLQVRPFELAQEGEVLYVDRDRERSLAFRLFRDGVRQLILAPGVNFHELLKFLEIISIRYTGVRSSEDDMVVLLWKAGFQFIEVEAVEGLVSDDDAETDAVARAHAGTFAGVPEDFDLPLPRLKDGGEVAWVDISPESLAPVVHEDSTAAVPDLCVRLIDELTLAITAPGRNIPLAEALPALRELRDFLLSEGTIHPLLQSVRLLRDLPVTDPVDNDARDTLVSSFVDATSLARLLRSVPRDSTGASAEVMELLGMLPGDHLRTLIAVLGMEKGEAARRAARSIIETYVPTRGAWMRDQMLTADADVASELLRAIAHASVEDGLAAADQVVHRPEMEIQFELVHLVGRAPISPGLARLAGVLAASPHDEIRMRALELIRNRAIQGAFRPLVEHLKRATIVGLDPAEAQMAGEAMAKADALGAMSQFREWCKPPGMFSVVLPQHVRLHYVAVSGLAILPGDDPERLITAVKGRADADLQRFIVNAMIRRRRLGRGVVP